MTKKEILKDKYLKKKYCKDPECVEVNPQPIENFGKCSVNKDGLKGKCKACKLRQDRIWGEQNPDKRKGHSIKQYWPGLNALEAYAKYIELLEKQNNVCAICKQAEKIKHNNGQVRRLAVDHCHETGKVRGLLCAACNYAVGLFKNNPECGKNLLIYLEAND